MRSTIESQIGVAHLRERVQFGVRVILPRDLGELGFACAVLIDVNLRDAPEQFREHEIAVFRFLVVIISGGTEDVRTIERRHCFLLFRANYQHDIVKSAHDPLRAEQYGKRTGRAGRFGVHGRDAMQFRIDLWNERAELQLLGKLSGVKVSYRPGLNFPRIDLCIVDRFLASFNN